jgi:hypothetical protein
LHVAWQILGPFRCRAAHNHPFCANSPEFSDATNPSALPNTRSFNDFQLASHYALAAPRFRNSTNPDHDAHFAHHHVKPSAKSTRALN